MDKYEAQEKMIASILDAIELFNSANDVKVGEIVVKKSEYGCGANYTLDVDVKYIL